MLPHSLTKWLVNHAPSNDVTEGYAADWARLSPPPARAASLNARPRNPDGPMSLAGLAMGPTWRAATECASLSCTAALAESACTCMLPTGCGGNP